MASVQLVLLFILLPLLSAKDPTSSSSPNKLLLRSSNFERIKKHIIDVIRHLDAQSSVSLLGGLISIERQSEVEEFKPEGPLSQHVDRYLRSHAVRLYLPQRYLDVNLSALTPTQGRSKKIRQFLIPLMLALQVKTILAFPLVLLVAALVGLQTLGTSFVALVFSGAALLRSWFGESRRGSGAISRVSYEVKQPPSGQYVATPTLNSIQSSSADTSPLTYSAPTLHYFPPIGIDRNPEYTIFSSANNERRKRK